MQSSESRAKHFNYRRENPDRPIDILLIDDDSDFSEAASSFLESKNNQFSVTALENPKEGLKKIGKNEIDCIVCDYKMPEMNGIELLKKVREDYSDLPFILFTGKGSEEIASKAMSNGVTDYLKKEAKADKYKILSERIENAVEKYRSRKNLKENQKRLSLFFEQSPIGVIEWDENFNFLRMNKSAQNILGYKEEDLKGESWEIIVPEKDQEQVTRVVNNLLKNESGYHSINQNVTKDGERIICEWHNRVITDEKDNVVAVLSQFQDITENKRKEEKLQRKNEQLEILNSIVRHDIRNHMNIIDLCTQEILNEQRKKIENNKVIENLEKIQDRTRDTIEITKNSRDLIETITTGGKIKTEKIDLSHILNDEIENFKQSFENTKLKIQDDIPNIKVKANKMLSSVFRNILNNAVQHNQKKVPKIEISVKENKNTVTISFKDNGEGIKDELKEKVFGRGEKGMESKGTGIGLYLVDKLIDAYNGKVWIEDNKPEGSIFNIKLRKV